ncbi:pyrroloquinoline quinone precursor peptide PqqA [Streptomyces sp. NPDC052676]
MHETKDQTSTTERNLPEQAESGWQTPEFTVIDTALEVTAYSLNSR